MVNTHDTVASTRDQAQLSQSCAYSGTIVIILFSRPARLACRPGSRAVTSSLRLTAGMATTPQWRFTFKASKSKTTNSLNKLDSFANSHGQT